MGLLRKLSALPNLLSQKMHGTFHGLYGAHRKEVSLDLSKFVPKKMEPRVINIRF